MTGRLKGIGIAAAVALSAAALAGIAAPANAATLEQFPARVHAEHPGADYSGQQIIDRDFRGQDLSSANFSGAYLENVDLRNAKLMGADFTGAVLERVNLADANLAQATFENAMLHSVPAIRATLANADLRHAHIARVDFGFADLTGADLTGSEVMNSHLTGAILRDSALVRTKLIGVDLTGADFAGADLTGIRAQVANEVDGVGLIPRPAAGHSHDGGDVAVSWPVPRPTGMAISYSAQPGSMFSVGRTEVRVLATSEGMDPVDIGSFHVNVTAAEG